MKKNENIRIVFLSTITQNKKIEKILSQTAIHFCLPFFYSFQFKFLVFLLLVVSYCTYRHSNKKKCKFQVCIKMQLLKESGNELKVKENIWKTFISFSILSLDAFYGFGIHFSTFYVSMFNLFFYIFFSFG